MKHLLTICLLWAAVLAGFAQENGDSRRLYAEAESNYTIGRLDEARQSLSEHITDFSGDLLQSAYRLLALCSLGLDEDDDAERYALKLLQENPYYSTNTDDPQRFVDMVNRIKSGRNNTITTASSQAESLDESPVPVMLITEDMIRISGARNLKEVLVAYVPGMMDMDCNDDINIAMRGIYSQGQEKMLIMLNGHRLNSYSTNVASPDFSISLEKVRQIEVLRGPASSLYGGVALSAVVNVITKRGADIDGVRMRVGGGSYGMMRGDLLFGKRFFDLDLLVWGSLYKSDGQRFFVPRSESGLHLTEGNVLVGRVGPKPSHDLGVVLNWRGLSFLYNSRLSQVHSPYTASYTHSPYDYARYATYRGLTPSFCTSTHHTELTYSHQWERLFLSGSVTYDLSDMTRYQVISDSAVPKLSLVFGTPQSFDQTLATPGIYRYHDGQEYTLGVQLKGDYVYMNTSQHKGLVSFGAHLSRFELDDSRYVIGSNFYNSVVEYSWFSNWAKSEGFDKDFDVDNIATGRETSADAYLQLKHRWGPFILNGGLRYDYKRRYDDDEQYELSPRIALIYVQPKWHASLSYSKSFVDAPYLYRKTNVLLYQLSLIGSFIDDGSGGGGEIPTEDFQNLKSERLYSWQFTVGTTHLLPGLSLELNGYYNRATDLIYPQRLLHVNIGEGKTWGIELSASYHRGPFDAYLSAEWLHIMDASYRNLGVDEIPGIPSFAAKSVLAWRFGKNLRLHTYLRQTGKYTGYEVDLLKGTYTINTYHPRFLMDLGADYTWHKFCFSANVHNLFNTHYMLTGVGSGPIQQQGRWFTGTVSYQF